MRLGSFEAGRWLQAQIGGQKSRVRPTRRPENAFTRPCARYYARLEPHVLAKRCIIISQMSQERFRLKMFGNSDGGWWWREIGKDRGGLLGR